jgi:hypothetical protein
VINVDVEFVGKELGKCPIAEVEDVTAAHAKKIVDETHIERANFIGWHCRTPPSFLAAG